VRDLFKGHPDLDELMTVDAKGAASSFTKWKALFLDIRAARYDLVIVANAEKTLHLVAFMAGIRHRVGWKRKWGFLLNHSLMDRKASSGLHEIDSNLELVRLVSDKTWDGSLRVPVDETAQKRINEKISKEFPGDQRIVVIHAGTSNPKKRWGQDRFAQLCGRLLKDNGVGLLLIGGPEEKAVASQIRTALGRSVPDWTGETTLKDLAALFSHPRIAALVSCDSGPVHVAWMSGVPVVALYAQNAEGSNPKRWGPRDENSRVIYKPIEEVGVEEVAAAAVDILGGSARR
jgi:ADP-heptose:LPS heptosyltransferase